MGLAYLLIGGIFGWLTGMVEDWWKNRRGH